MKSLLCFIPFIAMVACNSTKSMDTQKSKLSHIEQHCPDDGSCSFEVLKNKSLSIEKDGIGALYPKIEDGTKTILKFVYKRNPIENTEDSSYTEEVYAEIDSDLETLSLKGKELSNVKLLFARLCFCRGQTGYYPINQGQLNITKISNTTFQFELEFKIDEVPQVITKISQQF